MNSELAKSRTRHDLEQIVPKYKIFNFLYVNKTYKCKLCGDVFKGNLGKNPNEHHKDCNNLIHFCPEARASGGS